jgi:hypothetical protein
MDTSNTPLHMKDRQTQLSFAQAEREGRRGLHYSVSREVGGAFLASNSDAYDTVVAAARRAHAQAGPHEALAAVSRAARFANRFHPGRFADGALENISLEIGMGSACGTSRALQALACADNLRRRRVLHVASAVFGVGGHTRMLHRWICNDQESAHSIVLTSQGDAPVPTWLESAVRATGGVVVALTPQSDIVEQAAELRQMSQVGADVVMLHHGGTDPVPTLAFATHDCPPVGVINHADHAFWLGGSVADSIINLRTIQGGELDSRRFAPRSMVLPIPLELPGLQHTRAIARQMLGVSPGEVVLVTIGRALKYRPCGDYDFVKTGNEILDRNPKSLLFVVGASAEELVPFLRCAPNSRMRFIGALEDPGLYRAAADVFLESFPFGSNTSVLEAALHGLPVVPAYDPLCALLVAGNDSLTGAMTTPVNEEAYIDRASELIRRGMLRADVGDALRDRVRIDHVGDGWSAHLSKLYEHLGSTRHHPRRLPEAPCLATALDVGLSVWSAIADGKTGHGHCDVTTRASARRHAAFVAKDVGNYGSARRSAFSAARSDPLDAASWRLLFVSLLGGAGGRMRAALRTGQPWWRPAAKLPG